MSIYEVVECTKTTPVRTCQIQPPAGAVCAYIVILSTDHVTVSFLRILKTSLD
jgi:hypothetical protein